MLRRIKATTASVFLHLTVFVWLLSFHAVPTAIRIAGPDAFERTPLVAPPVTREPITAPPPAAPIADRAVEPVPAPPPPPPPEPSTEIAIAHPPELPVSPVLDQASPPPEDEEVAEAPADEVAVAAVPRREIGQLDTGFGIEVPASPLEQAIRALSAGNRPTRLTVGSLGTGEGSDGVFEARSLPRSPGNTGSNIEILSDARGVDFEPYLVQVLASVRRNWAVLIPESVRMGQRGRVAIQVAVATDGEIPKLVISSSSGLEPLDHAAVGAITASEPFPPLPREFSGDEIHLQFNFLYNRAR